MKYAIIIPDGCADEPQESLQGKTPLQAAQTPAMDLIAKTGIVGAANHVPPDLPAGSAVANMSLFGYDPVTYFSGRAPLEAAAQGIPLAPEDWAIRCNLVTVQDQQMRDFTADHISSDESAQLLESLQDTCDETTWQFIPGVSYRNLLIYRGAQQPAPFTFETRSTPPHDLTGQSIVDDFPRGPGSHLLSDLMNRSSEVFSGHQVNQDRRQAGHLPATNIWLWGLGKLPQLPDFAETHGKTVTMITAVDLLRGIAALIGWHEVNVPGATGYTDTDYAAKGQHAVAELASQETDIVCVHVEATDEASHEGDLAAKIAALENIDQQIVAPLHQALQDQGEYRILVTPDHPTLLRTKTHSHGAVPFTIAGSGIEASDQATYDEVTGESSPLQFPEGWKLMEYFLTN